MTEAVRSPRRRLLIVATAVLTAAAVLAAYLILTADPARAKGFATLFPLEGTVEVREDGGAFSLGTEGQTLREGDTVRTGPTGRAEIEYFDGSTTRLDAGTEFTLKELSSDPGVPDSKTIVAEQTSGKTLNRVVKITESDSRFETETPTAVASVQGTEYVVIVHPDGSSEFWVLEGELVIILPDGTEIVLTAGQGVVVTPDGAAGAVFDVDDEQLAELCTVDPSFCPEEPEEPSESEETEGEPTEDEENGEELGGQQTPGPTPAPAPPAPDPPVATITHGPNGVSSSSSATFRFTSDTPGSTFQCSLDTGAFSSCTSPRTYVNLSDGEHRFRVRAIAAALTGPVARRFWSVDTTPPPPTAPNTFIRSGPDPVVDEGEATATFVLGSDQAGAEFECSLDNNDFGECPTDEGNDLTALDEDPSSLTVVYTDLGLGSHTFQARARVGDLVDPSPAVWSWCIGECGIRITLTWVAQPTDLDLHVETPLGQEVYYGDPCLEEEDGCWAQLNWDVTDCDETKACSETITIFPGAGGFEVGTYTVWVDNYSCSASFGNSQASVEIFGGGAAATYAVSAAQGDPASKTWNVATLDISGEGEAQQEAIQALESDEVQHPCGASQQNDDRFIGTSAVEGAPATTAVRATMEGDAVRVEWEPGDLEAEVRVGGEEFPAATDEGEHGCRGTGHCLIEDVGPGDDLFLTVFPDGVDALEPLEDVNAVRFTVPDVEEPGDYHTEQGQPQQQPAVTDEDEDEDEDDGATGGTPGGDPGSGDATEVA